MLRLKPELSVEAQAYAERIGISLNALVSVALRDYLDQRAPERRAPSVQPQARTARAAPAVAEQLDMKASIESLFPALKLTQPKEGMYGPCPCGSGKKWKFCHGVAAG